MTVVSEDVVRTRDKISGWVLKGSEVVNAVACRRFGVLENDEFLSYRQPEDKEASARYPLHARCEVSGLDPRDILVRAKGKSTFVAIVAGKYEKIEGYQFSVLWPTQGQSRSAKTNRLILGFRAETVAARWQTAFLTSIERLAMVAADAEISSPPMPMPIDSPQHAKNVSTKDGQESMELGAISASDSEGQQSTKLTHNASSRSFHDVDEGVCRSLSFNSSAASGHLGLDTGTSSGVRPRTYGFWTPWKLVNGLAIYKEEDPSEGVEAFMVSCIVRSTPSACFNALMSTNKGQQTSSCGFLNMEILEKIDDHADFVHSRLVMHGCMASLLAPRVIVLDRNWRKEEEDGTYIVVMKSSERFLSEDARERLKETLGGQLWDPVRARVVASVFTIAPLQDKYFKNASESPEALLTMVLKIDLGGVLSPSHLLNPLMQLSGVKDAWIESLLMTVVALRDHVEQSRFVSPPFTTDSGPLLHGALSAGPSRSICRWSAGDRADLSCLNHASQCETQEPSMAREPSIALGMTPATGTCNPAYWTCPGAAGYRVRGSNYLVDKKKIVAPEPVFKLLSVDLVKLDQPTPHIARYLTSVQNSPSAFSFVVQIMVPGPPHLALAITWGSRDESPSLENAPMALDDAENSAEPEHELPPFELTLIKFFTGDDEVRNSTFKLIPHIVKGSFIIRQSVGSTPVLLGKKLKQYYFKTAKYIEVDIDVGSSYTAATVVNMVSGVTKTVVVDLAIVLEGKTQQELPEALLGTVRLDRIDLGTAVYLSTENQPPSAAETLASDELAP